MSTLPPIREVARLRDGRARRKRVGVSKLTAHHHAALRQPVPGRQLFVANNDWWLEEASVDLIAPYWAEVSLRVAERILHDNVGLPPPAWLDKQYFNKSVLGI